jgi:aspartate aminotransferase
MSIGSNSMEEGKKEMQEEEGKGREKESNAKDGREGVAHSANALNELESLRASIREVTEEIMLLVKRRLDIAKAIGDVKRRYGLDIVDERAEDELRSYIFNRCKELGLDRYLVGRLLNILLLESTKVQVSNDIYTSSNLKNSNASITSNHNVNASVNTPTSIFSKARMLESKGKSIIHLEIGEPNVKISISVKDALMHAIDEGRYHYTESKGISILRDAIARVIKSKYNVSVDPNNDIIVTVGGRFAVNLAMLESLTAGDEVIVIEPSWPAYKDTSALIGAKVRVLRAMLEDSWSIDIDRLSNMINSNTRVIVLNYPNNPTGKIIDADTLDAIVDIAKSKGITIISDEVYSDLAFNGKFKSILEYGYENSIAIHSISKGQGLTGLRLGYAVTYNKSMIDAMSKMQGMLLTCVAEPIQYAAVKAIEDQESVKRNVAIIRSRIKVICDELRAMQEYSYLLKDSLSFMEPDGAMYVFVRVAKDNSFNISRFVDMLLENGVAVTPGNAFGSSSYYGMFIRISAAQEEDVLTKGMHIIRDTLVSIYNNSSS